MIHPRKYLRRRGDTLIEVIFSLAILSSLMVIALSGALLAWRTNLDAAYRSQATYIAERQSQALKAYAASLSWDQFTSDPTLGVAQFGGIGGACGPGTGPSIVSCTSGSPQFFVNLSPNPPDCGNSSDIGNWSLSSISGNNNVETLSSSASTVPCANTILQSTLSSTYTVGIYVHDVSTLNTAPASTNPNTTLRFDIVVTWPSLVRRSGGLNNDTVDEVVYLSQEQS